MRRKYCLVAAIAIISTLIFSGITQASLTASIAILQARSQLVAQADIPQNNSEDEIIFGYIEDAPPVSSKTVSGVSGYCKQLKEYLESQIWDLYPVPMQRSQRRTAFKDVAYPDTKEPITEVIEGQKRAIECGPNSINRERIKELMALEEGGKVSAKYSNKFFTTSTKILIKESKLRNLEQSPENLKIGVLGNTTTQVIGKIYGTSHIKEVNDRSDAIEQLKRGGQADGIDAYASDEILLMGIRTDENFEKRKEFVIEPKIYGFTREEYGVVIYNDDRLRDKINDWISNDGQAAKHDLERLVAMSSALSFFVSRDYFYLALLIIPSIFILLLISHPWFIFMVLKFIPVRLANRFLDWLKARRNRKGNNDLVIIFMNRLLSNEVFTLVAHKANDRFNVGFIGGDAAIKLVEEVGIQPLLQKYRDDGLPEEKAEEKVAEVIAQQVKSNHQIYKMLQTWVNAAGTTAATEITTKIVESVLDQTRIR